MRAEGSPLEEDRGGSLRGVGSEIWKVGLWGDPGGMQRVISVREREQLSLGG